MRPLSLVMLTRFVLALSGMLTLASFAQADTTSQQQLLREARAAERALEPARAERLYQQALQADESSRASRTIRARLEWLRERDDDGYRPLIALIQFQRLERHERGAARVAAFEQQLHGFTPGRVTREGWALVARLHLEELDDPVAALAAYQRWHESPGASEAEQRLAASGSARALERMRGPSAALAELDRAGMSDSPVATRLRAERIARIGTPIALLLIALALVAASRIGRWRGWTPHRLRAALSGPRVLFAAYVLVVPALLAWQYDRTHAAKLARWLSVLLVAVLASALIGTGVDERVERRRVSLMAALAGLATLSAAFVMAARTGILLDVMLGWEQAP